MLSDAAKAMECPQANGKVNGAYSDVRHGRHTGLTVCFDEFAFQVPYLLLQHRHGAVRVFVDNLGHDNHE